MQPKLVERSVTYVGALYSRNNTFRAFSACKPVADDHSICLVAVGAAVCCLHHNASSTARAEKVSRQTTLRAVKRDQESHRCAQRLRCLLKYCARRCGRGKERWGESQAGHGCHSRKLCRDVGGSRAHWWGSR